LAVVGWWVLVCFLAQGGSLIFGQLPLPQLGYTPFFLISFLLFPLFLALEGAFLELFFSLYVYFAVRSLSLWMVASPPPFFPEVVVVLAASSCCLFAPLLSFAGASVMCATLSSPSASCLGLHQSWPLPSFSSLLQPFIRASQPSLSDSLGVVTRSKRLRPLSFSCT